MLDPGHVLREIARDRIRRNAFLRLRQHGRAMPRAAFLAVLAVLVGLRVHSVVCMIVAGTGQLLDRATWATGAPVITEHVTPFHAHPNPFGWGFQLLVWAHDLTGVLLFTLCLIPLVAKPGTPVHVRAGRAFVVVWLVHLLDGLINSGHILVARGFEPTRYFDVTGQGFSLYLYLQFAFISALVIDFLAHGLAALQYKNRPPPPAMRAVMLALPMSSLLLGVALAVWAIARLARGGAAETPNTYPFAIVYVVQIPAYLYLIGRNVSYWLRPTPRAWLQGWVTEHQRNMMFCVQVTLYTGLANLASRFVPEIAPFVFAAVDVSFLIWLLTKERTLRRQVVRSRLGLALVAALRAARLDRASRPTLLEVQAPDARWVAQVFDLDRSGRLDREDLRHILSEQGIELREHELDHLMRTLDLDGSGAIDRSELATFLATWFGPEPRDEHALALAFRALDDDGDGLVSRDELDRALRDGADAMRGTELDALMHAADLDGSGAIDWDEFETAMRPTKP
ncbi:MAG: EF-hand domain-containing protein [Myxococcota bacterium]|nr:EF-hand domain-containing protein [Myxococcota bacterium]